MRFKRIMASAMMAGIALVSLSSCGTYMEFGDFVDQLIPSVLGKDILIWNAFYKDAEAAGFKRGDTKAEWYSYEGKLTSAEQRKYYISTKLVLRQIKKFNPNDMTPEEQSIYYTLVGVFENQAAFYNPANKCDMLLKRDYINYDGGYVINFQSSMVDYCLREEQDVIDMVDLTKSTTTAFESYLTYANDRIEAGYALSDYTINKMKSYLDGVSSKGKDYALYKVYENKINSTTFLSDAQKIKYIDELTKALDENYMPAIKTLSDGLTTCLGKCEKDGYLSVYENGTQQYKSEIEMSLGYTDVDLDSTYDYIKEKYDFYSEKVLEAKKNIDDLKDTNPSLYQEAKEYAGNKKSYIGIDDPNEMIPYLKEFAKTIVPNLTSNHNIDVKYMDENYAKVTSAMAYYRQSPFDDLNSDEHITLNQLQIKNSNELLTTMAHEGYPGHLYQSVYDKEQGESPLNRLLGSLGAMEGWAMYVEIELFDYIIANAANEAVKLGAIYNKYYTIQGYIACAYVDILVNYKKKTMTEIEGMKLFEKNVEYQYQRCINSPCLLQPYGYGVVKLIDLHDKAKNELGNKYDVVDFNKELLVYIPGRLDRLEIIVDNYINLKK